MDASRLFHFGDFTLDTAQRLLYRCEERLRVQPKLIDLLIVLVEHKGAIVSHEEIVKRVWPNVVVEEGSLRRNITLLRKHLDSSGVQYIENVPKRGYRLAVEVSEVPRDASQAPSGALAFTPAPVPEKVPPPSRTDGAGKPSRARWDLLIAALAIPVLGIVVSVASKRSSSSALRMTQITANAPDLPVLSAAISPDGHSLAYAERTETTLTLYLRHLDSPKLHRLESPPDVAPSTIQWFPNNAQLLLGGFDLKARQYVAWTVSILGDGPSMLLSDAYKPSLSGDARSIAFYRNRNELWLSGIDGADVRLLATAPPGSTFTFPPQFTADSQYVLVGRRRAHTYDIVIEAYRIADGNASVVFHSPGYGISNMLLTTGHELLVMFSIGHDRSRLVRMHVDLAAGSTSASETLMEFEGFASSAQMSADGRRVTAVVDRAQTDIYIGDLDATGTGLSNVRRLTLNESWDRPSTWLPDSRTVLFNSNRHGAHGIYSQRIDASIAEPLVANERNNTRPLVSPDQKWLWYYSMEPGDPTKNPTELMRRPLAGGPAEAFGARVDRWRGLRCARAGTCIRAEHEDAERVFYSFDPTDGSGRELARAPWVPRKSYFNWDLSPDGKRIAYVDGEKDAIGIMSLKSDEERREIRLEGFQSVQAVSWDVHGTGLYVACFDDDDSVLLHVSLEGDVVLMRYQPLDIGGWATPSPDGRHLMISDWTKASNVWLFDLAADARDQLQR